MKQTLIILTLLISALWSCKTKTETKTKTASSEKEEIQTISINKFENYVSTLEQIPLPLNHNPLAELPKLSKHIIKVDLKNSSTLGQVNH
ncbi:hypothetical protein [Labilibaculum antarcticum]|nr:hypothetical protein [Labilibaculum antarcticum]